MDVNKPVYIHGITHDSDISNSDISSLVFIWGLDTEAGQYFISVNQKCLKENLTTYLPEDSLDFQDVYNELNSLVLSLAIKNISEAVTRKGESPDILFKSINNFLA